MCVSDSFRTTRSRARGQAPHISNFAQAHKATRSARKERNSNLEAPNSNLEAPTSGTHVVDEEGDDSEMSEQITKTQAYIDALLANHVWIGECAKNVNQTVIVTRWLGERICCNQQVLGKWHEDAAIRRAFFDDVCTLALYVISLGFFHGDIRLPNIVVDDSGRIHIVDWDELRCVGDDRSVPDDQRYPEVDSTKFISEGASRNVHRLSAVCLLHDHQHRRKRVECACGWIGSVRESTRIRLARKGQFWRRSLPEKPDSSRRRKVW